MCVLRPFVVTRTAIYKPPIYYMKSAEWINSNKEKEALKVFQINYSEFETGKVFEITCGHLIKINNNYTYFGRYHTFFHAKPIYFSLHDHKLLP